MSESTVSAFIIDWFPWLLIAILLFNQLQKRYLETGEKKRFASLYIALLVLAVFIAAALVLRFNLTDLFLVPVIALLAAAVWIYRGKVFPYASRCTHCGKRLGMSRILFHDTALCAECEEHD